MRIRGLLDPLLDTMSKEARFVNYILLQHGQDAGRFVIYETWLGRPKISSRLKCRDLIGRSTREQSQGC